MEAKGNRWLQRKIAFRSWDTMWLYPATVIDVFPFVLKIRVDVDHQMFIKEKYDQSIVVTVNW